MSLSSFGMDSDQSTWNPTTMHSLWVKEIIVAFVMNLIGSLDPINIVLN